MKVYDTVCILATDMEINEIIEGSGSYNLFFGTSLSDCFDNALMAGYSRDNCYEIFIGVKNDISTKIINGEAGN